jgi:miniconductance mechanosensitive channel
MTAETVSIWLGGHPSAAYALSAAGALILSLVAYFVAKHWVMRAARNLVRRTKTRFDDILLQETILRRLSYLAPFIVIYSLAYLFPFAEDMIRRIAFALLAWIVLLVIGGLLTAFNDVYITLDISKGRPIKGYVQIAKLVIYGAGTIIIICGLVGRSPLGLLSGFGAMTAVVLLIFRDTILSFVASLQISTSDLLRVGDWISVPAYDADGDVADIALHTVKIQNWDKTFTVIPTHKLLEVTFKNWRGMQASGGRRIKRSVYLDLGSIKFCDEEMVERFKGYRLITDYVEGKQEELQEFNEANAIDTRVIVNGRRMTNIGTFRAYVAAYLRNHGNIHQEMTFLVRQLPPGPGGLPLEIYVFTNDTAWANYEAIQADIFDHILAVVPEFDLRVFQNPTGGDFGKLAPGEALSDRAAL